MKSLPPKYFVDAGGRYLGAFAGAQEEIPIYSRPRFKVDADGTKHEIPPDVIGVHPGAINQPIPDDPSAIEVPLPPPDGRDVWNGEAWVSHSPAPVDLDAELSKRDPFIRALVELIPGGLDAVKLKIDSFNEKDRSEP